MEYREIIPDIDEFWELFETTGWNDKYRFSKAELKKSLNESWYSVSVYKNDELIGFGRVISDGIYHALIADMIIHPDYQGDKIGSTVLKKLLKKCTENNIRDIQLFAAKGKSGFYKKHHFYIRPEEAPGMQLKY